MSTHMASLVDVLEYAVELEVKGGEVVYES